MKNLARIISILIAFCGIILIINEAFDMGVDFQKFANKVDVLFSVNLYPAIAIAACAYCLERNDSNYILRIIPFYMLIPIIMSMLISLFEIDAEWFLKLYLFINSTLSGVTILSLILLIKPNNRITIILRYIAFGFLAANVLMTIITWIKVYMVETLPNVYGYNNYGGFNFSTISQTKDWAIKIASVTAIAEEFILILLFITNYAFSDKIELDVEEIDYEAVKQDAINAANMQMQNKYNPQQTQAAPDRSASEKGLMNVNNQLGQNSNVGKVETQAKEVDIKGSSLDSLIPLSKGPVINANVNQEEPKQEQPKQVEQQEQPTPQPAEKPVEQTLPPNVDIQQEMQARVQQAQQQPQQPAPQQPTQNNQ